MWATSRLGFLRQGDTIPMATYPICWLCTEDSDAPGDAEPRDGRGLGP